MLKSICRKGVALVDIATFNPFLKPSYPLGRAAVGEGVRRDITPGLPLQAIFADGTGSIQPLFDIAFFENPATNFLSHNTPLVDFDVEIDYTT